MTRWLRWTKSWVRMAFCAVDATVQAGDVGMLAELIAAAGWPPLGRSAALLTAFSIWV
jgi:hypothetical protein